MHVVKYLLAILQCVLSQNLSNNVQYVTKVERSILLTNITRKKSPLPPPQCESGQSFCENPLSYPEEHFLQRIIENFSEVERLTLLANNIRGAVKTIKQTNLDFLLNLIRKKSEFGNVRSFFTPQLSSQKYFLSCRTNRTRLLDLSASLLVGGAAGFHQSYLLLVSYRY